MTKYQNNNERSFFLLMDQSFFMDGSSSSQPRGDYKRVIIFAGPRNCDDAGNFEDVKKEIEKIFLNCSLNKDHDSIIYGGNKTGLDRIIERVSMERDFSVSKYNTNRLKYPRNAVEMKHRMMVQESGATDLFVFHYHGKDFSPVLKQLIDMAREKSITISIFEIPSPEYTRDEMEKRKKKRVISRFGGKSARDKDKKPRSLPGIEPINRKTSAPTIGAKISFVSSPRERDVISPHSDRGGTLSTSLSSVLGSNEIETQTGFMTSVSSSSSSSGQSSSAPSPSGPSSRSIRFREPSCSDTSPVSLDISPNISSSIRSSSSSFDLSFDSLSMISSSSSSSPFSPTTESYPDGFYTSRGDFGSQKERNDQKRGSFSLGSLHTSSTFTNIADLLGDLSDEEN